MVDFHSTEQLRGMSQAELLALSAHIEGVLFQQRCAMAQAGASRGDALKPKLRRYRARILTIASELARTGGK